MGEGRGVHRVLVGKPEGKRQLGRPRRRWEDNIKMDLQEVGGGCGDWMELAQDRDRSTSIPTVNMWCAHTTNPSNPIAIIAKIIPRFPNAFFFPLS
jgi:hypothetical protein